MVPNGYCKYTPSFPGRECTSGASWWASQFQGKPWPTGWGDAMYWPGMARRYGFTVNTTCAPNTVMCVPPWTNGAGGKGHVAFVTGEPVNGRVAVIEMNFLIEYGYDFRPALIAGCEYIHLEGHPSPPPEDNDLTPQQAQMLQDIHDALFKPVQQDGGAGYPAYAPGNNLDIVRRKVSPYKAGYPPANPPTGVTP